MNKSNLTLSDINIIALFLSKHGDEAYRLCQKKGLNFQTVNDINYFFSLIDKFLDKVVSTFEIELILFRSSLSKILKSKKRRIKQIAFSEKLQNYFFGYQPAISYLFEFSSAILPTTTLPTKTSIIDPDLKPVTINLHRALPFLEDFLQFNFYLENISVITDYSDTTELFPQNQFKHEFDYLLYCFKK